MPPKKSSGNRASGKSKIVYEEEEEEEQEEEQHDEDDEEESSDNSSDSGSNESDNESDNSDDDDDEDQDDDEDEEDEDSSDEEPPAKKRKGAPAKPAKKAAPKAKKPAAKKVVKSSAKASKNTKKKSSKKSKKASSSSKNKSSNEKETRVGKIKSTKKSERLEEARKAYKWWEAPKLSAGINWKYLEHPGVSFPPSYVPHNVPLLYDGNEMKLTPAQEEIATFFAALPLDGPQLGNPSTKPVFEKNFFEDFLEALGPSHTIKKFEKCDFSRIRSHLEVQKNLRKVATDEEKQIKKEIKEASTLKFGYALIDGRVEKMGNYNIEPPGLFRGRGAHPKTGKLKKRAFSELVALNMSEDACVPVCTLPGHAWESVQHDPQVTWLSGWIENVQNQNKYVMLAASSSFKGKSDMDKYTKAITLKSCIHRVRQDYTAKIKQTKDTAERQLGTAMWVIDVLALRVGGEKGEDEADTVGCCSLRVEHLTFNANPDSYEIELEFLGKDSMLFKQNINFALHGELGKQVYNCLRSFCKGKKREEEVFDTLDPPMLNKHLQTIMKGLTAKVFRTYNASVTLEKELPSAEELEGLSVEDKVLRYNAANREVAILCNHQKTVSKAAETMFENLAEKLQTLNQQRNEMIEWKELLKKKKENKIRLKADDSKTLDKIKSQIEAAEARRDKAKTNDEKLAAVQALDLAKGAEKEDKKRRFLERHLFKTTPSSDQVTARIEKWVDEIRKLEVDIRNRDENKEVALGTSKINYMDPRISVAWCKRCEVPVEKIFARTLRDKFNWAMAVPPDWKFE